MERATGQEASAGADERYENAPDGSVVAGMRARDPWAYHEFFERLVPVLLEHAHRGGVRREERWMIVVELLDDLAIQLTQLRQDVPRSLEAFAVIALRRRLSTIHRKEARQRRIELGAATLLDAIVEPVVLTTTSEASLRASRAHLMKPAHAEDGDPATIRGAVGLLGRAMRMKLSPDEARLLEWVAERVPQAEAAAWLGISHGALRVRIHRLKARIRRAAREYEASLEGAERRAVSSFLDRVDGGKGADGGEVREQVGTGPAIPGGGEAA